MIWQEMNKIVEEIVESMFQEFGIWLVLKKIPISRYKSYENQIIEILLKEAERESGGNNRSKYIALRIRQYLPFLIYYKKIIRVQTFRRIARFFNCDRYFGYVWSPFISKFLNLIDSIGQSYNLSAGDVYYPDFFFAGVDPFTWVNKYLSRWYQNNRDFVPALPSKKLIKRFKPLHFYVMVEKLSRSLGLVIPKVKNVKFTNLIIFKRSLTYPKKENGVWKTKLVIEATQGFYLLLEGLHEMGHAIHSLNLPVDISIMDGFFNSLILKEAVSELFLNLLLSVDFLQEMCGLTLSEANDVKKAFKYYKNLIAGMSAVKWKFQMEYVRNKWNAKQAKFRYKYYFHRFMNYPLKLSPRTLFNIFYPVLYEGNYVIADELVKYITRDLEQNFGKRWWKKSEAGKWLKENWFSLRPGDPIPHLDEVLRFKFLE